MSRGSVWHDWTADEEEFILQNFDKLTYTEIGNKLGLSKSQIKNRAQRLGCWQTKDEIERRRVESAITAGLAYLAKYKPEYRRTLKNLMREWKTICRNWPDKKTIILLLLSSDRDAEVSDTTDDAQ